MQPRPGQDPGHLPAGFTWADLLAQRIAERGSLSAIAEKLAEQRAFREDIATIERGLRRLRSRGHLDGGVWGQRLLRAFGLPPDVERRVRWMGQYHTRFTDLPTSVCRELLQLWDRPPVSESSARAWLHLGLASVALRLRQGDAARQHLQQAALADAPPGGRIPAAQVELALAESFAHGGRDRAASLARLADAASLLDAHAFDPDDEACLRARLADQRAWHLNRPAPGFGPPDPQAAAALYATIPADNSPPFALCRRENGLGWCALLQGDRPAAIAHARASLDHAGDGGFLRLRAMALNLLANAETGEEAAAARRRAAAIAARLEDEELRLRFAR